MLPLLELARPELRTAGLRAGLRTALRLGAERDALDRELLDLLLRDDDERWLPPRDFLARTGSVRTINANAAVTNTNPILL